MNEWYHFFKDRGIGEHLISSYSGYTERLVKSKCPVIFEFEHLSKLLGIKNERLATIVNSPNTFYRTFEIPKRSGGVRTITAPYPSLLACQKWIYKNILLAQPVHDCAHGFIPGRSIVTNAEVHLGTKSLLKMDLQDFFPSIPINWVINFFEKLGYAKNVSFYLAALCCYEDCLSQGSATSPYLTNILLRSFDDRLKKLSDRHRLSYTRYADDLTFSGDFISPRFVKYVEKVINDFGLTANERKTRLHTTSGQRIVTGLSVAGDKLTLPRSSKRELKKEVYFISKFGFLSHINKQKVKDPFYLDSLYGKVQFLLHIEPDNRFASTAKAHLRELRSATAF